MLPPLPQDADKKVIKATVKQMRLERFQELREDPDSGIHLSYLRPILYLDPILYLPMTSRERSRLLRWRMGWLPSKPIACVCGDDHTSRRHLYTCLMLQLVCMSLLLYLPIRLTTSSTSSLSLALANHPLSPFGKHIGHLSWTSFRRLINDATHMRISPMLQISVPNSCNGPHGPFATTHMNHHACRQAKDLITLFPIPIWVFHLLHIVLLLVYIWADNHDPQIACHLPPINHTFTSIPRLPLGIDSPSVHAERADLCRFVEKSPYKQQTMN